MKITLPSEEDGFYLNPVQYFDREAILITPRADAKWTKDNLIFRSLVVDSKTMGVLSSGFPKFMNLGEKPDCYPNPDEFIDWEVVEKIDGTLVIVDYYEGKINLRTRGTVTYKTQLNSIDFEMLLTRHPDIIEYLEKNRSLSLLFELVTPNNIIVIKPEEVKFYFLGAIDKSSLTLKRVDNTFNYIAPTRYSFNSLNDITNAVKVWKGQEGVVLVYNKNQSRVKIKSDWYVWLHRIKAELSSENRLTEFYIKQGLPSFDVFYKQIETDFDYEVAKQFENDILKLCDAGYAVKNIIDNMKQFIQSIRNFETRKEKAAIIKNSYDNANRAGMLFTLLDGKELNSAQLTKLIIQCKQNQKKSL